MTAKKINETTIDTQLLYQKLITLEPGETAEYDELSKIISRNVQLYGMQFIYTAEKMALRDHRMVFVTVKNVGIRRLLNDEIPEIIGRTAIRRIRKESKRSAKKIVAADFATLTNESKIQHNMSLSVLGAFAQMTNTKTIKAIKHEIQANEINQLSYAKTLEMFKQN